jgi:hypothetical protein
MLLAVACALCAFATAAQARTYTHGYAPSPCNIAGQYSENVGIGIWNGSYLDQEVDLYCGSYGIHPVTSQGYTLAAQYGGTTSSPQPWRTIDTHYDAANPPNGWAINMADVWATPLTTYTGCGCQRYRLEATYTVISPGTNGVYIASNVLDSSVQLSDYAP